MLDSLSQLPEDAKKAYLEDIELHGTYDDEEMGALRRLIVDGGAHAFKHLVDVVRDIRVQQEIGLDVEMKHVVPPSLELRRASRDPLSGIR